MNREALAARLLVTFLAELEEQIRVLNTDLLALEVEPADPGRINSLFRVAHTLKGAAHAAGVPPIEQVCHGLESLLAEARDGSRHLGGAEFALLFGAADALSDALGRLRAGRTLEDSPLGELRQRLREFGPARRAPAAPPPREPPAHPAPVTRSEGPGSQVRVEGGKLDALLAASNHLLVTGGGISRWPHALDQLHRFADRCTTEWTQHDRRLRLTLARSAGAPALLLAVHDMRENLQRLTREAGRLAGEATQDARFLAQATEDVSVRVRQLRLRPFAESAEALPRVVRDVALSAGKEVDFELTGGAVELDRAVLDGLREPLIQLVRNAVDHGIESPAARRGSGKPLRGRIQLSALQRGDRVQITLADDGAGLDLAAIRAQLERQQLPIPADEGALARRLFEGGFSTRTETTATSGRGVGLDIVRTQVERMRGTVAVNWEPGRGTTFVIECPPTLASLRTVLVSVGSQLLAIPTSGVERLLRLRPGQVRHAEGREVVIGSGTPVPLISLARLLPPLSARPATEMLSAVLLQWGGRRLAVVVDELLSEQEVVLRPLKPGRRALPEVSGAAILELGQVALVLDVNAIIARGLAVEPGAAPSLMPDAPTATRRRRILVVDDSLTTRSLEQSILESAGYDVVTAVDGADGWRSLQEEVCDLVVTDVEMPRMDGFALCAAIRSSTRFKVMPVVLVTALETADHRARGLEVGADAYLGKSSFEQQRLLDTIHQLIG